MSEFSDYVSEIEEILQPYKNTKIFQSLLEVLSLLFYTFSTHGYSLEKLRKILYEYVADEYFFPINPNFDAERFIEHQEVLQNTRTSIQSEQLFSLFVSLTNTYFDTPEQLFQYAAQHIGSNNITPDFMSFLYTYYFVLCRLQQTKMIKIDNEIMKTFTIEATVYVIKTYFPNAAHFNGTDLLYRIH